MSKPEKFKVPLANGEAKFMLMNWAALADAESVLDGESLLQIFGNEEVARKKMGFRAVLAILWAGLKAAGSDMTYEQVANNLDGEQMNTYFGIVSQSMAKFIIGKKNIPEDEGNDVPLDASTSQASEA